MPSPQWPFMDFTEEGIVILLISLHEYTVEASATCMPSGKTNLVKGLWLNASCSMHLTVEGMIIEVKQQREKAYSPILTTEDGTITDFNLLQFSNAYFPIIFTVLGISILIIHSQCAKANSPIFDTLYRIPLYKTSQGICTLP